MRRMIVAAFFGVAGLLGQTTAGYSCSPMPQRFVSPFEKIDQADYVYVGRVSLASKNELDAAYYVQVVKSFKGDAGTTLRFKSHVPSSACGFVLTDGYYVFYQSSGLVKALAPQFLYAGGLRERFETADDALAAVAHYFAVMKAADTAPPIVVRSERDASGKTVATLDLPETVRARVDAALAGMNGCMKSYSGMFPGSYFDIKAGIVIDWGERPNYQSRGAGSCVDPLRHVYDKPGTYTVRVAFFKPPQSNRISPGDWTAALNTGVSIK